MNKNLNTLDALHVKASSANLRISPQKLNLLLGLVRGRSVMEALDQLRFSKKRIASDVRKVFLSAVSNAENHLGIDAENLYVSQAYVGKTIVMKRFMPRARGRASRIAKPFSKMEIILTERVSE